MKRRNKKIIIPIIALILIGGVVLAVNLLKTHTGILEGKITLTTGNCMPMACVPEQKCVSSCFSGGVKRDISIRKLRRMGNNLSSIQTINGQGAFNNNDSDLIKIIQSNESGNFITILPVGNYSIFIVENGSGILDGLEQSLKSMNISFNELCNNIEYLENYLVACPVEIKNNQTTIFNLEMGSATY